MRNYQFSGKQLGLLIVAIVVVVSFAAVVYWESQQTVLACLGASCGPSPPPYGENVAFNSFHVNSPTNITLTITNSGVIIWGLTEYFVRDSNGDTYSNSTWAGPTLSPRATTTVVILLNGKLTGQPFQFQSGHTYSITVVTTRNNPFSDSFIA